jgi:4-hydroxy-tetrahydrodipicolinate synthase
MRPHAHPATWLAGYIPDLPTPFDENDRIDLAAFAKLCERQIEAGVPAVVVCETAGEASTLTPAEQETIICAAVQIARGRTRVIAGAGSNSTSQAIALTRRAEAAGADAVLSVVPYYNKPMQIGIQAHFRTIADSTALPIILHDIPSRTIRELSDETLARMSQSRQFIGLRDGTGDVLRPMRLRSRLPSSFRLLSGDDATALAFVANGGDGCISTISNVAPELCQALFLELPAGTIAVCALSAKSANAAERRAFQGEPGCPEVRVVHARLYPPEHPPADRGIGRTGESRGRVRHRGDRRRVSGLSRQERARPSPAEGFGQQLERNDFSSNRHPALSFF